MSADFHRVFTHWDGDLWLGAKEAAQRVELTRDRQYVVLPVARPADVCIALPDGRRLCDYGPEHEHRP